jgi:hypothetical protein
MKPISFVFLLQLLFITLKLTNYITWPWWQVLLPLILNGVLCLASAIVIIFTLAVLLIWAALASKGEIEITKKIR